MGVRESGPQTSLRASAWCFARLCSWVSSATFMDVTLPCMLTVVPFRYYDFFPGRELFGDVLMFL